MTIEELKVIITAETAGLQKELNGVKAQLNGLNKTTVKATTGMSNSFKKLARGFSVVAIVAGLAKVGKEAVNVASDLQEVQNVVDVAFGSASAEIDKFAKNSLRSFGLSELAAKRTASTFMAMSNGLGIVADDGKKMSVELTKLSGDMASFYNVSQDVAQTALSGVFTGETESLKKFGVVMTQANLEAFALSRGITKSYQAMSEAEKVALRYNFVLNSTKNAQGDFARTSGSWANQVRLLKEQWSQLLGIMGQALVKVLTPMVKVLNDLLASAISVANALSRAFGFKGIKTTTASVQTTTASVGDLTEDLGSAEGSAKKLQKTLASFDELNVMADNSSEGGDSGAGGGGGLDIDSSVVEGSGDVIEEESNKVADKFREFVEECKTILDKWVKTIPKLEFNFDADKALEDLKNIGLNIFNTIAGWGTFVISLGIEVANDLDIGALLNGFLSLVESASNLASKITDALVPALLEFYDTSGLDTLVQWIGEHLKGGMEAVAAVMDEWAAWFEENRDDIVNFGANLGLAVEPLANIVLLIADVAWGAFATILSTINDLVQSIAGWLIKLDATQLRTVLASVLTLTTGINVLNGVAKLFGISFADLLKHPTVAWTAFKDLICGHWIPTILITLDNLKAGALRVLTTILGGLTTFGSNAVTWGKNLITTATTAIVTFGKTLLTSLGTFCTTALTNLKTFATTIGTRLATFISTSTTAIATFLQGLIAKIGTGLTTIRTALATAATAIKTGLTAALTAIKTAVSSAISWLIANPIALIIAAIVALVVLIATKGDEIQALLKKVNDWIQGVFAKDWTKNFGFLGEILNGFFKGFKGIWDSVMSVLNGVIDLIRGVFTGNWQRAWEGVKQIFKGIFDAFAAIAKAPLNLIIGFLNTVIKGVEKGVNACIRMVNSISWDVPDWVPVIGGKTFGFNLSEKSFGTIPYLADGGVVASPTVAMIGEYPGARNNPEIVTPQDILRQTMAESNDDLIETLIQLNRQLITAISGIDMSVQIGDDAIASSVQRSDQAYFIRTGKHLLTV